MGECQNLSGCGFFKNYSGSTEATNAGWIKMFCNDEHRSASCKRKILKSSGQTPPDNMAPTGKILPIKTGI